MSDYRYTPLFDTCTPPSRLGRYRSIRRVKLSTPKSRVGGSAKLAVDLVIFCLNYRQTQTGDRIALHTLNIQVDNRCNSSYYNYNNYYYYYNNY